MDDIAVPAPQDRAFLAPISMEATLVVNGTKTGCRWFISQEEWDGVKSDEDREDALRKAFTETGEAFVKTIRSSNLMHPEPV